jgi:hypothetical protein
VRALYTRRTSRAEASAPPPPKAATGGASSKRCKAATEATAKLPTTTSLAACEGDAHFQRTATPSHT